MTIIIFDLALYVCIFIIHAEYFWLVMAGLKEKFLTLILKICVYHILFTGGTTDSVEAEDFDGVDLILL